MAWGICEVCWRLEGDDGLKWVAYCGLCEAWMCEPCRGDWWRRARAVLLG